ncbi:MAG: trypsin-like peptidase domain-containing protein [Chloroflexi bacterium]|nr:trypsin-like peptidase domain-containing protein [Chloroflexota bacterium]
MTHQTRPSPLFPLRLSRLLLAGLLASALVLASCSALTGPGEPVPAGTTDTVPAATPTQTNATNGESLPLPGSSSAPATLPSIADLVDKVEPAVVSIVVQVVQQTFFGTQTSIGSGSGVIFRADGYILTNNHVVADASKIQVTLDDGRLFDGTVVGTDSETDLAVVKIEASGLPTLPFGNPAEIQVGEWVVAIGNAAGLKGKPTVTLGIVSALDRSLQVDAATTHFDLVQTDAVINPGNSGGPLLNLQGEVIGINSVIIRSALLDGIGFAIGAGTAQPVAEQLVANGRVVRPLLGIVSQDIDQPTAAELNLTIREGVLVVSVEQGGPAQSAGLRRYDVIVAIGGKATPNIKALQHLRLTEFKPGQRVTLTVVRDGQTREFTLTLGES